MKFPLLRYSKQGRYKFSGIDNLPLSLVAIVPFTLHILVTVCLFEYFLISRARIADNKAVQPLTETSDRVFSRLDNYLDDSGSIPQESASNSLEDLNSFLLQLKLDVPEITEVVIQEQNGQIVFELDYTTTPQIKSSLNNSQSSLESSQAIVERTVTRSIPVGNDSMNLLVTIAMQTPMAFDDRASNISRIRLQYLGYLLPTTLLGVLTYMWLERSLRSSLEESPEQNLELENDRSQDEVVASSQLQQSEIKSNQQLNNYVKSSLVAEMSHELRSPLNAILGFAQIMLQESTVEQSQSENLDIINNSGERLLLIINELQENLAIINSSGERLLLIINELVDLSKIEVGRFSLENHNFDFDRWLDKFEQILKFQNCDRLTFTLVKKPNVPRYIHLDESRLRQILNNIIEYCSRSEQNSSQQITLQISATATSSDSEASSYDLCFEIENSSLVISEEELAGLFNPSVRARQQWQSFQGSSLSLPISRKLARLMGGDIQVIRDERSGTVFRLNVLAGAASNSAVPFKRTSRRVIGLESEQPDYRILVVDDSKTNRKIMQLLLEKVGFQVRGAENGQEAVDVWLDWQPDMIWMDLRMPIMNGYEATEKIKSHSSIQSPTIVALTASTFEEERSVFSASKYDDFVNKPFSENIIFDKIAQHLGVRYIYETTVQPEKVKLESTADSLKIMSSQWLTEVEQAAASLDTDRLTILLQQIPVEHSDLKQVLQKQVDNFDFERIMSSVEQSKSN